MAEGHIRTTTEAEEAQVEEEAQVVGLVAALATTFMLVQGQIQGGTLQASSSTK